MDEAAWATRIVKLSGIFNAYPEVLTSGVDFEAIEGATYLMNSEGTTLRYQDDVAFLTARADGQAPDGMMVRDAAVFTALEVDKMSSEAEIRAKLTAVAENVRALSKAPAGETFSGPVLFEPQASAQLLAQLVGIECGDRARSLWRSPDAQSTTRRANWNPKSDRESCRTGSISRTIRLRRRGTASRWQAITLSISKACPPNRCRWWRRASSKAF